MAQSFDNYKAAPIPPRESREQQRTEESKQSASVPLREDSFVEVAVRESGGLLQRASSLPPPQPIDPVTEQRRVRFYNMRQIAYDQFAFDSEYARAKVFYQQGKYMEDFEDDDAARHSFSSVYPYYQKMGYPQLRTYFTWRAKVRRGEVEQVSLSYAFLYLYELINLIGVADPRQGLEKLVSFWQAFRVYDNTLDDYIYRWLKDYHIFYPLSHSFKDFVQAHQLAGEYPYLFEHEGTNRTRFLLYAGISKYKIEKSAFYTPENQELVQDCFCYLLQQLQERFLEKEQVFEDLIFYPTTKAAVWKPFAQALFFPEFEQPDREVVLSRRERYRCRDNRWTFHTTILSENGKLLVSYLMKEMESSLRQLLNYNRRLAAKPETCDEKTRSMLARMGIVFPAYIRKCVAAFYALRNRREVTVDPGSLRQIRKEALETQERLIIPEEEFVPEVQTASVEPQPPVPDTPADSWGLLGQSLTSMELEVLHIALQNGDIAAYARTNGVMPEVLLEGINDKAMDMIGDTLLEYEGTLELYEDYKEKLAEMVREYGK